MKLGILSCSPNSYSTRRLRQAGLQRGHPIKVLNTLKFAIEITIPEGADIVGQTIERAGLIDHGINVLTLYRDASAIPNPQHDRWLQADDRLLCVGN